MFEIEKTEKKWDKYGLREDHLLWNGKPSKYKAVVQNGELVTVASREYVLLPNEEAMKVADEIATELGAKPFHEFTGEWFFKTDKNVIYTGENGHQAHAFYAWDAPVDFGGDDQIQVGYAVHNSIDRTMGFGAGLFTFRHACENMVLMGFLGFKGQEMSFDDRNVMSWIYNKHVGKFSPQKEKLKYNIKKMLANGFAVIEQYRRWRDIELRKEMFERLRKTLPEKYVPESLLAAKITAEGPRARTLWDGYNNITAAIWHNDGTDYGTKRLLFDKLHAVMVKV